MPSETTEAVPSETTEAVAVLEEAAAAAAALGGATDHGSRGGRGATRAADKAAAEAAELQRQRSRCADETKGGEGVERVLLRKITPSAVQGQSHYLAVPIAGLQGTGTSWQKLLVWQGDSCDCPAILYSNAPHTSRLMLAPSL